LWQGGHTKEMPFLFPLRKINLLLLLLLLSFLRELGRRLSLATDDPRETAFLFQRLSVALQQYNAVCFRGSFLETLLLTD
jgi:hypothetical protein